MFKESLISVVLLIVIYQIYIVYFEDNISMNDVIKNDNILEETSNIKPMQYNTPDNFEHPVLGKPDKIIPEGYLFNIKYPQPWNVIVFNPNNEMKYLFIIKMNVDEEYKNVYSEKIINWYKFIPGISFNKNTSELIVPAPDENSALAVVNLILNNLKGDLDFKSIVENKLIGISLTKIRNYPSVRIKIIEQIMESINGPNGEMNESLDYEEDLAETVNTIEEQKEETPVIKHNVDNTNQPSAYEGGEFSYL